MARLRATLVDATTYRRLGYLLLGLPLGVLWFTGLCIGWSLSAALFLTPAVFGLAYMTFGLVSVEAWVARGLLDVHVLAPAPRLAEGPAGRLRGLYGRGFWRAQAVLWLRVLAGFPVAVVFVSLIGTALGMITAPLWVPFVPDGTRLIAWRVHTVTGSLALVPFGIVLLALSVALASPVGAIARSLSGRLLDATGLPAGPGDEPLGPAPRDPVAERRILTIHARASAALTGTVTVVWAATGFPYFWPVWIALPSLGLLGIHAWLVALRRRDDLVRRFHGSEVLAGTAGTAGVLWLFTVAVWALAGAGYFWPVWTLLGLGLLVAASAAVVIVVAPDRAAMARRIETLTATRAGAVDVQDSELRRIERDLHDGAQARLVALGMSLGMAEQRLADDPGRAGELLSEARVGAELALRELRDLARGIHPPILADRGLEAALAALADATPTHVSLSVDVAPRPGPAIESAAYFVASEALANAAKHAHADWIDIRIARIGPRLEVEVTDDGVGEADPAGGGLVGLRRRVQALDGSLHVSSPPGGPTTIYAELPCA